MAETRKSLDQPLRSAFADAAGRLEQVAHSVKAQQAQETQPPPPSGADRMTAISPDEAWSRKYMSQAIGPRLDPMPLVGLSRHVPPIVPAAAGLSERAFSAQPVVPKRGAPIGADIGRGLPQRRSWLARLFLGPKS
jgi:hypothetical protein